MPSVRLSRFRLRLVRQVVWENDGHYPIIPLVNGRKLAFDEAICV